MNPNDFGLGVHKVHPAPVVRRVVLIDQLPINIGEPSPRRTRAGVLAAVVAGEMTRFVRHGQNPCRARRSARTSSEYSDVFSAASLASS